MSASLDMFAELSYDPQIQAAAIKARTKIDEYIDQRVDELKKRHTANCEAAATKLEEDFNREATALLGRLSKAHKDVVDGLSELRSAISDDNADLNGIQVKLTTAISAHEQAVEAQQKQVSEWANSAGKIVRTAVLRV